MDAFYIWDDPFAKGPQLFYVRRREDDGLASGPFLSRTDAALALDKMSGPTLEDLSDQDAYADAHLEIDSDREMA
jgi:hypothetical protein